MWQDEIAIVYDAAAQRGIGPRECDETEMWILAAALGVNHADEDEADPLADGSGISWNERRARALAAGLPEPKFSDFAPSPQERAPAAWMLAPIGPTTLPDPQG